MKFGKSIIAIVILTLSLVTPAMADTEKDKDFAVPAFSDLPLLGGAQNQTNQRLSPAGLQSKLNPFSDIKQLQWLDINRDFQLNDFDVKQFRGIIGSLNGEKLTGLQLTIRFRTEQKNQRESFPVLYDLDRDGMFTSYDVDYFTQVINKLDDGALRGNELIHKYQLQIFPQNNKSK